MIDGYKYNGNGTEAASKYLRNLTMSEDEGVFLSKNLRLEPQPRRVKILVIPILCSARWTKLEPFSCKENH